MAANEGTQSAKFLGCAVPSCGYQGLLLCANFFNCFAGFLGRRFYGGANPVGVKLAGQNVVDGHALRCNFGPGHARHKSRQATACSIGQAQDVDG